MVDKRTRVNKPHDTIADALGAAILSGDLAPGQVLDSEADASATHNVSRSSYREAIRTLAAKGLVSSRQKAGTRVLERERWNLLDLDVLRWLFIREPDEKVLIDLFGLRGAVEPAAAALAARNWTEESIIPLRAALDTMISYSPSDEAWQIADKAFHDFIFQVGGNAFLISLSSAITTAVRMSTRYKMRGLGPVRNSTVDHLRVYEAISGRDQELASERMRDLVDIALNDTLRERRRTLAETPANRFEDYGDKTIGATTERGH